MVPSRQGTPSTLHLMDVQSLTLSRMWVPKARHLNEDVLRVGAFGFLFPVLYIAAYYEYIFYNFFINYADVRRDYYYF
jgi:hypothetical protein